MGLPLYQRPDGPVADPVLDDAQLVHDSKGFSLHEIFNRPVGGTPPGDAVVHESNGLPLNQCSNGSVSDLLSDDSRPVYPRTGLSLHQYPSGSTSDPLPDATQVVHDSNGFPLHRIPSGPVSDPLQDDTKSAYEPQERDPHIIPTFTTDSLTNPHAIVLYLPPFLSSLPRNVTVPSVSVDKLPLATETHLPDIDPVSLSLHKALHHFSPLSDDYACLPYADAFNWPDLELPEGEEREWYAVVFRSRRKKDSDSGLLYDADRKAHEEAVSNGGLIMYWYGVPDPDTGMNLATCIWQSRRQAVAANSRPHHIRAMKLAAASYEIYNLERYRLTKVKWKKGILVEEFSGGECGW